MPINKVKSQEKKNQGNIEKKIGEKKEKNQKMFFLKKKMEKRK